MSSLVLDHSFRRFAVTAIGFYQSHLSPHKGFGCAHRIVQGGESCSTRIKRALHEESLTEALQTSRRQFADCTRSSRLLRSRNNKGQTGCIVIPCCLPL